MFECSISWCAIHLAFNTTPLVCDMFLGLGYGGCLSVYDISSMLGLLPFLVVLALSR